MAENKIDDCKCINCGVDSSIQAERYNWCLKCYRRNFQNCSYCHETYRSGKLSTIIDEHNNHVKVCNSCFSYKYEKCHRCGLGLLKHNLVDFNGMRICQTCFKDTFVCSDCKKAFFIDHRQNGELCYTCHINESTYISPHHDARAPLYFYGKGPHFFGIELEIECDPAIQRRTLSAKIIKKLLGDFIIIKHDGSLIDGKGVNNGFELVTSPATKDYHFKCWNHFFENLPKGIKSFNSENCGLHIHCSRSPLSQLTIAKILLFINDKNNTPFITVIAGRKYNRFCKILNNKKPGDVKKSGARNDRYEALNLSNRDTIEFRIFKGTLKRESLFKSIEFCDALIDFCRDAGRSISDCRKVDKFIEYVKLRKSDYEYLWAFICARWLNVETDLTKKMEFPLPPAPSECDPVINK